MRTVTRGNSAPRTACAMCRSRLLSPESNDFTGTAIRKSHCPAWQTPFPFAAMVQDLLAGASNGRLTPVVSSGDVSASMLRVVGEELGFQEGARDESEIVEESHLPEVRCVDDGRVLSHSACGQQLCIMLKSQADRLLARDSVRFLGGSTDALPNSYVAIGRVCKRCCRF